MSYAKTQRERLGHLAVDMQAIVDKAKRQNNRGLTSEERERFHALEADYSNLEETVKIAERSDSIQSHLSSSDPSRVAQYQFSPDQLRDEFRTNPRARAAHKDPYERAFSNMLRVHPQQLLTDGLSAEDRQALASGFQRIQNTMSTTTGSQGGYVVPQGFSDQLERAKKWFGGIEGVVGKFSTETGNPFPWPTVNDTTNKGRIIGQNTQVTETDVVFSQVTFNAYIGCSDLVLIPLALMQDSYFDMDALTASLLGERLGRLYNNKCTVGSGSSEPTGIVTAAVTAGNIYNFASGETATISYNDLVNIEHSVDPSYRYNPATYWMFSDNMLKLLKKLVDGQSRPLWQPGLTASFRDGAAVDLVAAKPTILDHPYIINSDMAAPGTSSDSILFGDMSTFKVREVSGGTTVMRLVERYADYLQVGFIAFQRFDSGLVNAGTNPICVGVQASS